MEHKKSVVNKAGKFEKDENGIYVKVADVPVSPIVQEEPDPKPENIRLVDMLNNHMLLLFRETRALVTESKENGRLTKDSAESMRRNLQLIMDLRKKEKELLETLTDEELQAHLDKGTNE